MRIRVGLICLLLMLGMVARAEERTNLFNEAWRFYRGDASQAMQISYADERWQMVDLPHDWRLTPDSLNVIEPSSDTVGWYRKTFTILPADTAKRVYLCFERIHGKSEIWLNGQQLFHSHTSCESMKIDVTPHLNAPYENNTLAIRITTPSADSALYRGAGITHDTWLVKVDRTHIDEWETSIQTTNVYVRRGRWYADLKLDILMRRINMPAVGGQLRIHVEDPDGASVYDASHATLLADSARVSIGFTLPKPRYWYADTPEMYRASLYVVDSAQVVCDSLHIPFGISTISYSQQMGLLHNDEAPLIQGATLDFNNRLTGYTAFRRAEALLIEHLQTNGYSAMRCPMGLLSEHLLTACDTLGVMVLVDAFSSTQPGEVWSAAATTSNIKRFRNHPSIIMWCIADSATEESIVASADNSRPIVTTDILLAHTWSKERTSIGDRTAHAYHMDAERFVSSITVGVSAPDTLRHDTILWLPETQRWTWHGYEGDTLRVNVYSRNDWVSLYLNDRLVGNAKSNKHTHCTTFYVPYVPGKLDAVTNVDMRLLWQPKKAKSKFKFSGRYNDHFRMYTEGAPKHLYLTADRTVSSSANGELIFVKIEVLDADGNILPDAEIPLSLHIRGPGLVMAAGNDQGLSPSLHTLHTHNGSAMVVIRPFKAIGTIRLTVHPEGLDAKDIAIKIVGDFPQHES
ncbi:MAG: DUF4982 domain-containing protein [Bacteroidaceae bacterium]|nr:DUF4982 domain-containing protein [Bacteroidaceae bacterium]